MVKCLTIKFFPCLKLQKMKIDSTGKVFYNDMAHELPLNIGE